MQTNLSSIIDKNLHPLCEEWKSNLQQHSLNTISAYLSDLTCFLNFFYNKNNRKITIIDLESIKINHLRSWLKNLSSTQVANSRSRAISAVKNFFTFLEKKNLLQSNSITFLKFPKKSKLFPKFIPSDTIDEISEFLQNEAKKKWIGLRNATIISLLYGSGLRISEAINLHSKDINYKKKEILVLGKGNKERIVPILDLSLKLLQDYLQICPFFKQGLIFFGLRGKKLQTRHFANILQTINQHFDYYFSSHTFRHSCATHLLSRGMDLRQIQELLGHKSLSSTQIYADIEKNELFKQYKNIF